MYADFCLMFITYAHIHDETEERMFTLYVNDNNCSVKLSRLIKLSDWLSVMKKSFYLNTGYNPIILLVAEHSSQPRQRREAV